MSTVTLRRTDHPKINQMASARDVLADAHVPVGAVVDVKVHAGVQRAVLLAIWANHNCVGVHHGLPGEWLQRRERHAYPHKQRAFSRKCATPISSASRGRLKRRRWDDTSVPASTSATTSFMLITADSKACRDSSVVV